MGQHMRSKDLNNEWDPKSLGGCVLHLPFYKYGKEATIIYDQSGQGNHGKITGATPTFTALTNGSELVTNGTFEGAVTPASAPEMVTNGSMETSGGVAVSGSMAASGWTATGAPSAFAMTTAQKHGGTYSCYVSAAPVSVDGFVSPGISKTAGHYYKFSYWYYLVSGEVYAQVQNGDGTAFLYNVRNTTTGAWTFVDGGFVETVTGATGVIKFASTINAEFYIDDVSITEQQVPTGWSALNAPTIVERSTTQKHGGSYATRITLDSNGAAAGIRQTSLGLISGKRYKISAWFYGVDIQTAGYGFTIYTGGAGGGVLSTTCTIGAWTYLEGTLVHDGAADDVLFYVQPTNAANANKTFYIDDVSIQEVNGYDNVGWYFDGVDDKVTGSISTISTALTYLFWIRLKKPASALQLSYPMSLGSSTTLRLGLYFNSAGSYVGLYDGSTDPSTAPATPLIELPIWLCFAATFDSTGAIKSKIYRDGINYPLNVDSISSITSPDTYYIGLRADGAYFMNAQIGEVLIFNRALSQQEIKGYYERTRHIYGA